MSNLRIDQHRKQLIVNLRDEAGATMLRRQVSTEWGRVRAFLDKVRMAAEPIAAPSLSSRSRSSGLSTIRFLGSVQQLQSRSNSAGSGSRLIHLGNPR